MPNSNYIEQIAALIKQDPSITVRQIASELKFADSKSVYYWLDKENVGGINEFKRLVLSQKIEDEPTPLDIDGTLYYPVQVPLFNWNSQQINPKKKWHYIHNHPNPRGLFAVRIGTNYYSPRFMQNDLIIVSQEAVNLEGAWILLQGDNQFLIGKILAKQIICPISLEVFRSDFIRLGLILNQQRYFSI